MDWGKNVMGGGGGVDAGSRRNQRGGGNSRRETQCEAQKKKSNLHGNKKRKISLHDASQRTHAPTEKELRTRSKNKKKIKAKREKTPNWGPGTKVIQMEFGKRGRTTSNRGKRTRARIPENTNKIGRKADGQSVTTARR